MNLYVPKDFVSVDREQFESALSTANYTRSGWADGEKYSAVGRRDPIALRVFEGKSERFFLCPKYFTPN